MEIVTDLVTNIVSAMNYTSVIFCFLIIIVTKTIIGGCKHSLKGSFDWKKLFKKSLQDLTYLIMGLAMLTIAKILKVDEVLFISQTANAFVIAINIVWMSKTMTEYNDVKKLIKEKKDE